MASNQIGELFSVTTWGESHGVAVGAVIDGCPAGVVWNDHEMQQALQERAPGVDPLTSPRKEPDVVQVLSGVFEGKTTGAPISLIIWNKDVDSSKYEGMKDLYRPGHACYTYREKYGVFDYRGGGRASARETAARVAAGAVAKMLVASQGIVVEAVLSDVKGATDPKNIRETIKNAKVAGDSVGGVVSFVIQGMPCGLGDPVYQKLQARLSSAMMSIPAAKGFSIGSGFDAANFYGSEHNDCFVIDQGKVQTETNHAGGVLGGISTGMPVVGKVVFKPTSSIQKKQRTVNTDGHLTKIQLPEGSRHDPCVALRATAVVKAMAYLVVADLWLKNRLSR